VSAPPRLRVLEALRHREFRLLWAGQTVSQIGDAAFVVALGWRAFTLTHKSSSLGIVLMVEALGLVATLLIGGVLADRYSRKLLLVGSDGARAVVIGALTIVDATGHLSFGLLIAFVALHGLGSGLFQPAFGGILPLLVEEPSLGSANALIGVSRQIAFVVGPGLAGVIYGLAGSSAIFAVDTASFLVSAAILLFARPRAYGVGSYGVLFTLQGVGMIVGSVALAQTDPRRRRGVLIYSLFLVNSVFGALIGLAPWFEGAAVLQVGRGFCVGFGITLWDTMVMQRVPQHMLSRVISMDWFGSIGLLPAGLGLWAVLSGVAAPGKLLAASFAFCTCLFLVGSSNRHIRALD
jgi:MFS family permease